MTDADPRARFWAFVSERDAIWSRREGGQPEPWTSDPILRDYHFTNVHRHKDPGTRWIVDACERRGLVDLPDVLFAVYAYRSLNRVSTFETHGFPDRDAVCVATWSRRLDAARAAGASLGSGRHLTYWARLRTSLPWLVDHADEVADSLREAEDGVAAIRALMRYQLFVGVFLGVQVVGDLVTVPTDGLRFGRDTVFPVSAGSRFGLGLATGTLTKEEEERHAFADRTAAGRRQRDLSTGPEEARRMSDLLASQPTTLSEPLNYSDLEHSCCEYARYWRLQQGDFTRSNYLKRARK